MKWGILGVLAALIGMQGKETAYQPPSIIPGQPFKPVEGAPPIPGMDVYKEPITPTQIVGQPEVFKPFKTVEGAPPIPGMDVFKQPVAPTKDVGLDVGILIARPTVTTPVIKPVEAIPDTLTAITRKKSTGWIWWGAPGGPVTSRQPTQEEIDSGLGCPEVPGIWTYPMESGMDLRYCTNTACPSNNWETTAQGERLAPTPAQLEDQGMEQPAGKRWFCRVCRTYQG